MSGKRLALSLLALALWPACAARGAEPALEPAIAALESASASFADRAARAEGLSRLGWIRARLGQERRALELAERSLALSKGQGARVRAQIGARVAATRALLDAPESEELFLEALQASASVMPQRKSSVLSDWLSRVCEADAGSPALERAFAARVTRLDRPARARLLNYAAYDLRRLGWEELARCSVHELFSEGLAGLRPGGKRSALEFALSAAARVHARRPGDRLPADLCEQVFAALREGALSKTSALEPLAAALAADPQPWRRVRRERKALLEQGSALSLLSLEIAALRGLEPQSGDQREALLREALARAWALPRGSARERRFLLWRIYAEVPRHSSASAALTLLRDERARIARETPEPAQRARLLYQLGTGLLRLPGRPKVQAFALELQGEVLRLVERERAQGKRGLAELCPPLAESLRPAVLLGAPGAGKALREARGLLVELAKGKDEELREQVLGALIDLGGLAARAGLDLPDDEELVFELLAPLKDWRDLSTRLHLASAARHFALPRRVKRIARLAEGLAPDLDQSDVEWLFWEFESALLGQPAALRTMAGGRFR